MLILCKLSCHARELPLLPALGGRPQLSACRALSGRPAYHQVFEARKRELLVAEAAEHRRLATAGVTPRSKRRRRWLPGTLGAVACSLAAAFCLEQEALREQRMQREERASQQHYATEAIPEPLAHQLSALKEELDYCQGRSRMLQAEADAVAALPSTPDQARYRKAILREISALTEQERRVMEDAKQVILQLP